MAGGARAFCACVAPPTALLGQVPPAPLVCRDPVEVEEEEQAAAEKAVTKEEFRGEGTAPAPAFTAAHTKVAG